jgi:hypothetical protein
VIGPGYPDELDVVARRARRGHVGVADLRCDVDVTVTMHDALGHAEREPLCREASA